jgi:beta-galactosidase
VEEIDALPKGVENQFTYKGVNYPATLLCDLLYTENASSLSYYEKDFYKDMPVITKNSFG